MKFREIKPLVCKVFVVRLYCSFEHWAGCADIILKLFISCFFQCLLEQKFWKFYYHYIGNLNGSKDLWMSTSEPILEILLARRLRREVTAYWWFMYLHIYFCLSRICKSVLFQKVSRDIKHTKVERLHIPNLAAWVKLGNALCKLIKQTYMYRNISASFSVILNNLFK